VIAKPAFLAILITVNYRLWRIEGFGLKSHLQGRLRAEMQNNEFKLYNQLTLLNATYKAYGQDLTIDKGQLLFAGDVRNTGVNITASRKASDWNDKTIAYLNLTGLCTQYIDNISDH
jgi:translocation and assembly module TamB